MNVWVMIYLIPANYNYGKWSIIQPPSRKIAGELSAISELSLKSLLWSLIKYIPDNYGKYPGGVV